MYIRPPTSTEFESIETTREAYRKMWSKITNVPERRFDGSREDIDALDFIEYEAGHHPEGHAGAAIIWGGVLVSTGVVSWAIGNDQHWVLVGDPDYPKVLILPYARLTEISHTVTFGKWKRLLDEAVFRLTSIGFSDEQEARLHALLKLESQFLNFAKRSIARLEELGARGDENREQK